MEIREYKAMYEVENNHFWYAGMRNITRTLFNKYLPKNKSLKILDAGCGTGRNIIFLGNYGQVHGFDISREAIKFCKKRSIKNLKLGSVDKIPFESRSFNFVTCFDVLGQIEVRNVNIAISEFYRVLKPGGVLLIRIAAYDWLKGSHDIAVHTKHRFEKKELNKLLKNKDFEVIKSTYANTLLFPFALIKRFFSKKKHTKHNISDVNYVNPLINYFLKIPFFIEAFLINFFDLPFGLSLIVVAKK